MRLSPQGKVARAAAWMPDGDSMIVSYSDELGGSNPSRFAEVSVDGGLLREVPVDIAVNASQGLAISPDGQTAVFPGVEPSPFDSESDLWRMELESGHAERIELIGEASTTQDSPHFIDEDTIVIGAGELMSDVETANGWVGVVDLNSGETTRLTSPDQTVDVLSLSPDGRFVVYDAFPGNERSKRALWFVPSDGSAEPSLLIEDLPGFSPVLDGDGRSVLVTATGGPGDTGRIERVDVPDDAPWLSD